MGKKTKEAKRILALLLSVAMILGNVGVSFADETTFTKKADGEFSAVQNSEQAVEDEETVPKAKLKLKTEVAGDSKIGEDSAEVEEKGLKTLVFENDDVAVTVSEERAGIIPAGATLSVTPIIADAPDTKDQYKEVVEKLNEKAEGEAYDIAGFLAYDIKLVDSESNELEPADEVRVSMQFKQAVMPEGIPEDIVKQAEVTVMHLEEDAKGEVTDVVDLAKVVPEGQKEDQSENKIEKLKADKNNKVVEAEFVTGSFSTYVVTWTSNNTVQRSVKIHYVDTDGNDITASVNADSFTLRNNEEKTLDLTTNTYRVVINGYQFQKTTLNNINGSEVSNVKVKRTHVSIGLWGSYTTYEMTYLSGNAWNTYTGSVMDVYMIYQRVSPPQTPTQPPKTTLEFSVKKITNGQETNNPAPGNVYGIYTNASCDATSLIAAGTAATDGKVSIAGLETGTTYYLKQILASSENTLSSQVWTVKDGWIQNNATQTVYVDTGVLEYSKTAKLLDWDKRTYEIELTASSVRMKVDPITVEIVADTSRSMYFPASLANLKDSKGNNVTFTGAELADTGKDAKWRGVLDTSKVYYWRNYRVPNQTVYATWWKDGKWVHQDASSYYPSNSNKSSNMVNSGVFEYTDGRSTIDGKATYSGEEYLFDFYSGKSNGRDDKIEILYCDDLNADGTVKTRLDYFKIAAKTFIENLAAISLESKVGIVTFAGDGTAARLNNAGIQKLDATGVANLTTAIGSGANSGFDVNDKGGTNQSQGLNKGKDEIQNVDNDRNKYVILMTDGAPNGGNNKDIAKSAKAITELSDKNNSSKVDLITVGVNLEQYTQFTINQNGGPTGKNIQGIMEYIASTNGKGSKMAYNATSGASLVAVFAQILLELSTIISTPAEIRDEIDPRFEITDAWITAHYNQVTFEYTDGKTSADQSVANIIANKEKIKAVIWKDQTVAPKSDAGPGWRETIEVRARDEYIGGNNVTTNGAGVGNNGSNETKITYTINGKSYTNYFPQPTVNVKADLILTDKEVTIFKGDAVPTAREILDTLFDEDTAKGYVWDERGNKEKLSTYTVGGDGMTIKTGDFEVKWYDADGKAYNRAAVETLMARKHPDENGVTYQVVVVYKGLGTETTESNANTVRSGKTYISGDDDGDPTDGGIKARNPGTNNYYGEYKVHVIPGTIQVIKEIDGAQSTDTIFHFEVEAADQATKDAINQFPALNGIYEYSLNATVKAGETTATVKILDSNSNEVKLPRGNYKVTEVNNPTGWRLVNTLVGQDTNCFYTNSNNVITFTLGYDQYNADVIKNYTYDSNDGGVLGQAQFLNSNSEEGDNPFIRIKKTFTGLQSIKQAKDNGFYVKLYDENQVLLYILRLQANASDTKVQLNVIDEYTYMWTIMDQDAGTYYVQEGNYNCAGYQHEMYINRAGTSSDPDAMSSITSKQSDLFTVNVKDLTSQDDVKYELADIQDGSTPNFILGSFTSKGTDGYEYFAWTSTKLSGGERQKLIQEITTNSALRGQFKRVTYENTIFFSGDERIEDGINYRGTVSYDRDTGTLTFAQTKQWNMFCYGTYDTVDKQAAEIELENRYTPLYSLPSTGGIGIYWTTLLGVLLMLYAMFLADYRRQRTRSRAR